jgi:hypothetical protein
MRLALIAAFFTLAALLAACGGDDNKSTSTPGATGASNNASKTPNGDAGPASDYFQSLASRFEKSRNDSDVATTKLNDDLDSAETLDEQKAAIDTFLETMIGVFDASITAMDALDPPSAAEQAHNKFRDDISEAKDISATLQSNISDADSVEAAQAVVDDFNQRVVELVDDAQAACRDLQSVADAQDISADLECKAA